MQFLKTLFWALLIGLGAAFSYANWFPVDLRLWGGLIAEVNLPLLLLAAFLLGLVPMLLVYHAVRWRLRQRLASTERALADLRAAHSPEPLAEPHPAATPATVGVPAEPVQTNVPNDEGPLFNRPAGGGE